MYYTALCLSLSLYKCLSLPLALYCYRLAVVPVCCVSRRLYYTPTERTLTLTKDLAPGC